MAKTRVVPARTLEPGDRILLHDVEVTILSGPEPTTARMATFQLQGRRHDTDVEGPIPFGTGGVAHLISRGGGQARSRDTGWLYRRHVPSCPGHRQWGGGNWRLLTLPSSQKKIGKSLKVGVYTGILHLAPADIAGFNVCPWSTAGCRAACLNMSGMGPMVQEARIQKTIALKSSVESRTEFVGQLVKDIRSIQTHAEKTGEIPAVRLNGTSDEPWEAVPVCIDGHDYKNLMELFPDVHFYDYTKSATRAKRSIGLGYAGHAWPQNYHLTYSRSEDPRSETFADEILAGGGNVAVVFRSHADLDRAIEHGWHGFPVKDATEDDARFLDPPGTVAGLAALRTAHGNAQVEQSGFVVDYPEEGSMRTRPTGFTLTGRSERSRYRNR